MTTTSTNPTLSDPLLAPFLSPTFTPTSYLNTVLPTLPAPPPTSTQPQLPQPHTNTQRHLTTLEITLQKLLSHLSTTSNTLLRLSPRLQYETKVLESQISSVRKALASSTPKPTTTEETTVPTTPHNKDNNNNHNNNNNDDDNDEDAPVLPPSDPNTPPAFTHLRTLHAVRQKLLSVQHLFEKALRWSAEPALPVNEVEYIFASTGGSADGVRKAREKVEAWRDVWGVFKGTVEEGVKGRVLREAEEIVRVGEEKCGIKEVVEEVVEREESVGGQGGFGGLIGGLSGWGRTR